MIAKNDQKQMTVEDMFQFRYPPFADTFDIHEPFETDDEKLSTQRITALIRQGKSMAVYGEAGTGKSMLIKNIINQLDTKQYRIALIPYGGLKPSLLLRELCEALDIDVAGRKSCLCRLAKNFERSSETKPFPVIIIDDAHTMQHQSFFDLCSLLHDAYSRTAAASLILVGQPVLKKTIELDIFAPVKTRLACAFKTKPLSNNAVHDFIAYRLNIAHAQQDIFDKDAIECIAADANGNRRVIMNIATMCMEEAARRSEQLITQEIVSAVAMNFK